MGEWMNGLMEFTYSQKVYDSHGKLIGVAGADCTLAWTAQLLEDIKPYIFLSGIGVFKL